MSWRRRLLDLLRVPHEPSAPAGDEDVRVFRAAPNYFLYRLISWVIKHAAGLVGLLIGVGFVREGAASVIPDQVSVLGITVSGRFLLGAVAVIEYAAIAGFVLQALGSLLLLRLDFEQRWYLVSNRSLRIREGLVRLRELTMTFANVQHVTIKQGPLQRLLGIADLQVRTAGGGGGGEGNELESKSDLHVAYFRGIANAEAVSAAIRELLRKHRDAGLGDPDDAPHDPLLLTAATTLAQEARQLRELLVTQP
ncbi:MAG TPA: PH domain-containing protein [Longimicrobiales bacterium]|nr:PH domain-containing protein [Longimicrobiales bacterium]